MLENLRNFFDFLGVNPIWPTLVLGLSFVQCLFPYRPIAKIKETKDKDGKKTYIIYENKNK